MSSLLEPSIAHWFFDDGDTSKGGTYVGASKDRNETHQKEVRPATAQRRTKIGTVDVEAQQCRAGASCLITHLNARRLTATYKTTQRERNSSHPRIFTEVPRASTSRSGQWPQVIITCSVTLEHVSPDGDQGEPFAFVSYVFCFLTQISRILQICTIRKPEEVTLSLGRWPMQCSHSLGDFLPKKNIWGACRSPDLLRAKEGGGVLLPSHTPSASLVGFAASAASLLIDYLIPSPE